jgi:hypothetical protein
MIVRAAGLVREQGLGRGGLSACNLRGGTVFFGGLRINLDVIEALTATPSRRFTFFDFTAQRLEHFSSYRTRVIP